MRIAVDSRPASQFTGFQLDQLIALSIQLRLLYILKCFLILDELLERPFPLFTPTGFPFDFRLESALLGEVLFAGGLLG